MVIKVNGKELSAADGLTVDSLIAGRFERGKAAVALNRVVLPGNLWEETKLKEGDALEIFTVFGGG